MKDTIIVRRYTDAFLAFAEKTISLTQALEELKALRELLRQNPDFKEFLETLQVGQKEKFEVIDRILETNFSPALRQFLKLLIEKGRIDKIIGITDYARVAYSHGREVQALLRTTYPLDTELIDSIKARLEKKLNTKFNLYVELEPDLLGGVQLIVGHRIIDGSVRKRLSELKEKLMNIGINPVRESCSLTG